MYEFLMAAIINFHKLWLKTTEMYSHDSGTKKSKVSITGLKSGCHQRHTFPLGESLFLLPASCGCWHSLACDCITPVFKAGI